jgi:hypothetical protein
VQIWPWRWLVQMMEVAIADDACILASADDACILHGRWLVQMMRAYSTEVWQPEVDCSACGAHQGSMVLETTHFWGRSSPSWLSKSRSSRT